MQVVVGGTGNCIRETKLLPYSTKITPTLIACYTEATGRLNFENGSFVSKLRLLMKKLTKYLFWGMPVLAINIQQW